jgi:hypothetical protein
MFWKKSEKDQNNNDNNNNNNIKLEPQKPNQYDIGLPCDHYQFEIKRSCGILSKFNKYFGLEVSEYNCDDLKELFFACQKYKADPSRNLDCLVQLKKYENQLLSKRIESIKQNDVWTARQEPPSDWNAPFVLKLK